MKETKETYLVGETMKVAFKKATIILNLTTEELKEFKERHMFKDLVINTDGLDVFDSEWRFENAENKKELTGEWIFWCNAELDSYGYESYFVRLYTAKPGNFNEPVVIIEVPELA